MPASVIMIRSWSRLRSGRLSARGLSFTTTVAVMELDRGHEGGESPLEFAVLF